MTPHPSHVSSDYSRVWIHPPVLAVLGLAVLAAVPAGCGSVQLTKRLAIFNTRHDVLGSWIDIDPAVNVAMSQVQMAVVTKERDEADLERRYNLVTQTDEPGVLILRRDHPTIQLQIITLEAHIGRFGDADREDRLVRSVRHRLKSLAGVDHAPVTLPPS